MIRRAWQAWVALWDKAEHPRSLAFVRIGVGLVLLWDLALMARHGLVVPLLGTAAAGGLADVSLRAHPPLWYAVWPPTPASAWALWAGLLLAAAGVATGTATRVSAIALVLLSAQAAALLDDADRGIDRLLRNVLLMLACSHAGATRSVDAWRATGSWRGDGQPRPAWPRHLLVLQLIVMYFVAGVSKVTAPWTPAGGFSALWTIAHNPAVARWPAAVTAPLAPLLQAGTAVTIAWELAAPAVLLVYLARSATTGLPGPLRAAVRRWRPELLWLSVGVLFHLGIAALLDLGIFPWAMLALYPAAVHPDDWGRALRWLRGKQPHPSGDAS